MQFCFNDQIYGCCDTWYFLCFILLSTLSSRYLLSFRLLTYTSSPSFLLMWWYVFPTSCPTLPPVVSACSFVQPSYFSHPQHDHFCHLSVQDPINNVFHLLVSFIHLLIRFLLKLGLSSPPQMKITFAQTSINWSQNNTITQPL